jgi:hypothetical protein
MPKQRAWPPVRQSIGQYWSVLSVAEKAHAAQVDVLGSVPRTGGLSAPQRMRLGMTEIAMIGICFCCRHPACFFSTKSILSCFVICRLVSCYSSVSTEPSMRQTPPACVARRHVLLSMTVGVAGPTLGEPSAAVADDETVQANVRPASCSVLPTQQCPTMSHLQCLSRHCS